MSKLNIFTLFLSVEMVNRGSLLGHKGFLIIAQHYKIYFSLDCLIYKNLERLCLIQNYFINNYCVYPVC